MQLLNFLVLRRTKREIARLANDVARRSRLAVWEQVYHQIGNMSVPEARGYVRAKASLALCAEVESVFERHGEWNSAQRASLVAQAKDKVVHLIMSDMMKLGREHFTSTRRAA